ncbi:MAG: hypothetical protein ACE5I3_02100 [Phycisphaerae bacterium]
MRTVRLAACGLACLLLACADVSAQSSQPSSPTSRPSSQPAGKNLLFNGDFEVYDKASKLPSGWTTKHPDHVHLVNLGGFRGRVLGMSGGKKLMASYGVDLTSDKIPVEANARYRCSGYTRSTGPNMKVFVKGYATVARRVKGELMTFDDIVYQMRKDIGPSEDWQPFNLDFEIAPAKVFSDFQHRVEYVRVRLWAFWPAGTCWFDDIRFEKVGPAPEPERRHDEAVTHVGLPPRLGKAATQPANDVIPKAPAKNVAAGAPSGRPTEDARFDEEQTWRDAVNAFRAGDHDTAARLADELLAHALHKGAYHVLAARALVELKRWEAAERHARWLLEEARQTSDERTAPREIESWQRDWARVVQAQVCRHTGRVEQARTILKELLQTNASPHARAAAERLFAEIEKGNKKD